MANNELYLTRGEFVKLSVLAFGAGGLIVYGGDRYNKYLEETNSREGIEKSIKEKYRVYIPGRAGEFVKYDPAFGPDGKLVRGTEHLSTQITKEEAVTIKEALGRIPSVNKFTGLILPFRDLDNSLATNGSFWGENWDFFLDPSKYNGYPQHNHLSNIPAINLELTDKELNDPLPSDGYVFIPFLSSLTLNGSGIEIKNNIYYPWTTQGERLRQVIVHEIAGHGLQSYATKIKVNSDAYSEYQATAMSFFGGFPLDTNNPILSSFAKVNGWEAVTYSKLLEQSGDLGKNMSDQLKNSDPKMANWPVWDRDQRFWGSLRDKKVRLSPYASYGPIDETFAEFFMFYLLGRVDKRYDLSLLSTKEVNYFDRMYRGLSTNPKKYIEALISENPGPAYNQNLFTNLIPTTRYKWQAV